MNYYYLSSILLAIYCFCYFIFPTTIIILQTTLYDFSFNLLYQRQPLIIEDKIVNIDEIIDLWFFQNLIYPNLTFNNGKWIHNNYKYLFITTEKKTEILLSKATIKKIDPTNSDNIIAIQLYENQSLIIPYKWKFLFNDNIKIYGIHDYITRLLSIFSF